MKRSDVVLKLQEFIETMDEDDICSHSKLTAYQLLTLIESFMIPKTTMTEPEYNDNGKQLQTKAVNKWEEE